MVPVARIREAKPDRSITVLSDEERAPFTDAAAEVEAAFIDTTGESRRAILEQMKAEVTSVGRITLDTPRLRPPAHAGSIAARL